MARAQLQLPGLAPARERRDRRKRAKRDWNTVEFYRALARNGLMPVHGGVRFADVTGRVFEGVYRHNPVRLGAAGDARQDHPRARGRS